MDLKKLESNYGEHFAWSRPYDYFFNREKREVTVYNRLEGSNETYDLDEIKGRVKETLKEKNIGIKPRKAPSDFVSKAVEKGLDLTAVKMDDVTSAIMFEFTGARLDIYSKLDEEEIKLFNAIPAGEKADLLELSKSDKFDLFMSFLYESKRPLEINPEDSV